MAARKILRLAKSTVWVRTCFSSRQLRSRQGKDSGDFASVYPVASGLKVS
jgi:hypothetical protein